MRLILLALLIASCTGTPAPDVDPTAAETPQADPLDAFFARVHAEMLAKDPIDAAYLGEPHDTTAWTKTGEGRAQERHTMHMRWLSELDAMDLADLSLEDALNVRLFRAEMARNEEAFTWRNHLFPMTGIRGTHTFIPSFLMTVHRIEDAESAATWIARVNNVGPVLDGTIERLQLQAKAGIRPASYNYPQMIGAIDRIVTGAPFTEGDASPLLAHFQGKLAALALPQAENDRLLADAKAALAGPMADAYAKLRAQLVTDSEDYTDDHGAWSLPDGGAYYQARIRHNTTTDLTPDQVHEIGLREVARIHGEMKALMPALGVEGELPALFEHLRTHPDYSLPETDEARERYLELARGYVAGMRKVLPEHFEHLPTQPLEVKRVQPWREKTAGKAFYQSPSTDGKRPGIFYANLAVVGDMPTYQLEALVYHEGIPGHHMQNAVSQRLDDLPPFRRFGHYTAYGEGWGLYSEFLPKELGFYQDPASDVGRLAMELWRACRLVVDTGLHHKKGTREQAVEYLVTNTPNPRGDAVKAIDRYMVWPGQATAYMIGKMEIVRLREKAKKELGPKFSLKAFHGVVLGSGPVPLDVLAERVDAWIATGG
ncbi:MAG: DUF885 family protein [Myxococcota bacterium]